MEEEVRKVQDWYQGQLTRVETFVNNYINRINANKRLNWRQKHFYRNRALYWLSMQKSHLGNVRDQRIVAIRKRYPNKVPVATNNRRAVLVGINYTGTNSELRGCVNDVYKLRDLLISQYGYKAGNIYLLLDEKATRKNILHYFTQLVKTAKPGDNICFTFSGHGYYVKDTMKRDERDGKDELIVSVDNKAILDDELKNILNLHLKKNVNMFSLFDNCHSGSILDLRYQYYDNEVDPNKALTVRASQFDTQGQVILLSGCLDSQVSLDAKINGTFNGVMTWVLVEVLKQQTHNVSWSALLKKIREFIAQNNLKQIPQMSSGRQMDAMNQKVFI